MKYLLLLLFGFTLSWGIAQSETEIIKEAVSLKSKADNAYQSGDYRTALSYINQAIGKLQSINKPAPKAMTDLKGKINTAISNQEKAAEIKKKKQEYDDYLRRAKSSISNQNYDQARSYLNSALDAYSSGYEAKRLLNELDEIKNRNEASSLVSKAEQALNDGDKREALRLYEQAKRLNSNGVSRYTIQEIENDIENYDRLTKEAENHYFEGNYQRALEALNRAKRYMTLERDDVDLRDRSNYKLHLEKGESYMRDYNYAAAEKEFETASIYAPSSKSSEIKNKINNARYQKFIESARYEFDNDNMEAARTAIEKAENIKGLDSEGRELKRKIYEKLEDIVWASKDYQRYLNLYPNGRYVAEAKRALYVFNFSVGESNRKSHNYERAISYYRAAQKYASAEKYAEINKKIAQTQRWERAGGGTELDFNFDLPLGFAATSLTTYDLYNFSYLVEDEIGSTNYIGDTGMGYTKHSKTSVFTPISFGVDLNTPIRIPSVPPLRVYAGLNFTSYSVFNLNQIEAVQDYEIYNEGDVYEPTGETIVDRDTLYFGLYRNGTKFTQFSGKLGVTLLDFLTVYVPFQKLALNVQPGLPCLECSEEEVQVGQFGVGLGVKLEYTTSYFTFSAFWENWNKNFNKSLTNNVMFDGSTAGLGMFSPNAFSRNLGVQMAYRINSDFSFGLRYENPVVRGEFRGDGFVNKEVHSFSQHLIRARLTYNISL